MVTRRKLVLALPAAALGRPSLSLAQQPGRVWRVGFLSQSTLEASNYGAFQQGMRELGYIEGKNVRYEPRHVAGNWDRVPAIAAELLQLKVDVIVAGGNTVHGVRATTRTVPIIMVALSDPVSQGLVTSLARPGGNITGIASISGETGVKRLELLISAIPKLSRVGVLFDPAGNPGNLKMLQAAAEKAGVQLITIGVRSLAEIETAVARMASERAQALYVSSGGLLGTYRRQIAELALKTRLPSTAETDPFPELGGLMSYGQNPTDSNRRAAIFVDKIFKGANPADIPVEQPTKFQLVINMKTAQALGLTFPQSFLVRVDRVIE